MTDAQKQSLERRPLCSTCVFFERELPGDTTGKCRKRPAVMPAIKKSVREGDATFGVWPIVWQFDWCGNHQDFGSWYSNDFDAEETNG